VSKRSEIINALRICKSGCCGDGCIYSDIAGANGGMEDRSCISFLVEDALNLIDPPRKSLAKLPCLCGSQRREEWSGHGFIEFKCSRCGFIGERGRTLAEAVEGWNKAVMKEKAKRSSIED